MKVLVANNLEPFVRGGAEDLADGLVSALRRHGHESELLRTPFRYDPFDGVLQEMAIIRAMEVVNVDHLIALKFPTYLLRHHQKSIWLVHQFRQAYDLFESGMSNIPDSSVGRELRQAILAADLQAFRESTTVKTISPTVADRLQDHTGIEAGVLYHPLNDPELFTGGRSDGYLFAGGRINSMKRQALLVEALALTAPGVRLVIAGPPDTPETEASLMARAEELGVTDRLRLEFGYLPRARIAELVNSAIACVTVPFDEDSLSYVAMEAAEAGKPIITTSDSGGVLGLVRDGDTGWVCSPDAAAIASAMNAAAANTRRASSLGRAMQAHYRSLGISWDRVVEVLVP
jgi:glycosyltransferase involved in cell wall biosynthesis